MDSTEDELNNITDLASVADWSGTTGALHDQLMDLLGKPMKLRDILFIPRPVWDATVAAFKVKETQSDGTTSERVLSPVELSRIEIFWRVTFLRLKATPDGVGGWGGSVASNGKFGTDPSDTKTKTQQCHRPHVGRRDNPIGANNHIGHVLPIPQQVWRCPLC